MDLSPQPSLAPAVADCCHEHAAETGPVSRVPLGSPSTVRRAEGARVLEPLEIPDEERERVLERVAAFDVATTMITHDHRWCHRRGNTWSHRAGKRQRDNRTRGGQTAAQESNLMRADNRPSSTCACSCSNSGKRRRWPGRPRTGAMRFRKPLL